MPSDTRSNINDAIRSLQLEAKDFKLVSLYAYKEILLKVLEAFTTLDERGLSYTWLWEHFKGVRFSIRTDNNLSILEEIIPENESVWFIALNGGKRKKQGNFWVYEGTIKPIVSVIGETLLLDEFYIVSKKLKWLICENHHDCLIGIGEDIVGKMKTASENFEGLEK
jgi:hypothetical protein